MKKITALYIMFSLLGALLLFHLLIYTQLIPYNQVWAGRLNSVEEMKRFELFSMLFNVFILVVLVFKYRLIMNNKEHKVVNYFIWFFVVFFSLNTIGNLFAASLLEQVLGGFTTLTSAVLCYVIVKR